MPKYAFFIALLILFPYFQVHAEEAEEQAATTMRPSPLESDSDHFGLLRGYGPVSVNDVTGVVRVQLPRIGPSSLLSVQPVVRTLDAAELAYASVWGHLIDNFHAVGLGASIGWGPLFVLDPTEMLFDVYGPRPITRYRHRGGTPDVSKRAYLSQTRNAAPLGEQDHRAGRVGAIVEDPAQQRFGLGIALLAQGGGGAGEARIAFATHAPSRGASVVSSRASATSPRSRSKAASGVSDSSATARSFGRTG